MRYDGPRAPPLPRLPAARASPTRCKPLLAPLPPLPARTPALALCSSRAAGTHRGRRTWQAEQREEGTAPAGGARESEAGLGQRRPTAGRRAQGACWDPEGEAEGEGREGGRAGSRQEELTPLGRSPPGRSPPWAAPQLSGRLEGRVSAGVAPLCRPIPAPTARPQTEAQWRSPPRGPGWPRPQGPGPSLHGVRLPSRERGPAEDAPASGQMCRLSGARAAHRSPVPPGPTGWSRKPVTPRAGWWGGAQPSLEPREPSASFCRPLVPKVEGPWPTLTSTRLPPCGAGAHTHLGDSLLPAPLPPTGKESPLVGLQDPRPSKVMLHILRGTLGQGP